MAEMSDSSSREKNNRITTNFDRHKTEASSTWLSKSYESFADEPGNNGPTLEEKIQTQSQRYSQLQIGVKKEIFNLQTLHKIKVDLSKIDQYGDIYRKKKNEIESEFSAKKSILVKDYDDLKLQLESEVDVIKEEKDKLEFDLGDIRRNIEADQISSLRRIEDNRVSTENEIEKKREAVQQDLKRKAQAFKDHVSEVRDTLSIQKRGVETELEILSSEFEDKKSQISEEFLEFKQKNQEDIVRVNAEYELNKEALDVEIENRRRLQSSKLLALDTDLKARRSESERLFTLFEKKLRDKEDILHRQFQEKEKNLFDRLETRKIKLSQEEYEFVKKRESELLENENTRVLEEQKFKDEKKSLLDQLKAFKLSIDEKCSVYERKEMELSKVRINEFKEQRICDITTEHRLKLEKIEKEYQITYQSNLTDLSDKSKDLTAKYNQKDKVLNEHKLNIQETFVRKIGFFEKEINSIRSDYDKKIESIENAFNCRKSEVELLFDKKLANEQLGIESQRKKMATIHKTKVSELSKQIANNQKSFEDKTIGLETEYRCKMDNFDEFQSKTEAETTKRRFSLERKINVQQASLEKEFKDLAEALEEKVLKRESELAFLFCQLGAQFDEKNLELDKRHIEKVQDSENVLLEKQSVMEKKYNDLQVQLEESVSLREIDLEQKYKQIVSRLESEYLEKENNLSSIYQEKDNQLDATFSHREADLTDIYNKKNNRLEKQYDHKNETLETQYGEKRQELSDSYNAKGRSLEIAFQDHEKELQSDFDLKSKEKSEDFNLKTKELETTLKNRALFLETKFEKKNDTLRKKELKVEEERAVVTKEKTDLQALLLKDNEHRIQDDVARLIKVKENKHIILCNKLNDEISMLKLKLEKESIHEGSKKVKQESGNVEFGNHEFSQLKKEFEALSKSNQKLKSAFLDADAENSDLNRKLAKSNSSVLELETQVSSAFGGGSLTNELEKELKRAEKKVSELNLVNTELIQRLNSANGKLDSEKISKQNMATNVKEVTRQLKKQNNIIPTLASEKTSNKMKTKVNAKKRPFKVLRSRSR